MSSQEDSNSSEERRIDLRKHVDLFFGERNGITPVVQDGVNYTEETLWYMSSRAIADDIKNSIVNCVGQGTQNFKVVECCAGLGGNSLAFLDSPQVSKVISYEIDPTRREMLRRNIDLYGFSNRSIVPDADDGFTGIPEQITLPDGRIEKVYSTDTRLVLYMDPPWLPLNIAGHLSKREDHLLNGIKLGSKTLEEWIADSRGKVDLIVIRLPPSYNLKPVEGFCYYPVTLPKREKHLFYFIYPKTVLGITESKQCPSTANRASEAKTEPATCPVNPLSQPVPRPGSRSKPESKSEQGSKSEPSPKPKPSPRPKPSTETTTLTMKQTPTEERAWELRLRSFLFEFLRPVIPNDNLRNRVLGEEIMPIWMKAFTHISYDVNENYELIEYQGDRTMKAQFVLYIMDRFPDLDEGPISELENHYLSKPVLAELGRKYGLTDYVRTISVDPDIHIAEDLIESVSGALYQTSDLAFDKFGSGNVPVFNYTKMLFDPMKIDLSILQGQPTTIVKQIFERLHWSGMSAEDRDREIRSISEQITQAGTDKERIANIIRYNLTRASRDKGPVELVEELPDGNIKFTIAFTEIALQEIRGAEAIKRSKGEKITPIPEVIAYGIGNTRTSAKKIAYANALEKLKSWDITEEFAIRTRQMRLLNKPKFSQYKAPLTNKLRNDGFINFDFKKIKDKPSYKLVQLQGIKKDGSKEVLGTAISSDESEAQIETIQQYIMPQ